MPPSQSPWHPENEVERLLCSLAGVVSARVVANPLGRLDEIHILASPLFSPKQIVRNVESALSAGLGIVIDRRIVSVAQIRRDAIEPASGDADTAGPWLAAATAQPAAPRATPPPSPAAARRDIPPRARRLVFVGYDAHAGTHTDAVCNVVLRHADREHTGSATGASTAAGRARAAARAAFAALADAGSGDRLGLEFTSIVDANGRSYVLVAARAVHGRDSAALTGVAPLTRSPEEAAILAALQATNRWTGAGG
jgi:hypothetical protein